MKSLYPVLGILFFVFLSVRPLRAESVSLDNVQNGFDDTLILANELVVFNLRLTNPLGAPPYNGVNNGFMIYSPNGATWDHTAGSIAPGFESLPWSSMFVLHYDDSSGTFVRTPGGGVVTPGVNPAGGGDVFGLGPTAVQFSAAAIAIEDGMQPGFNEVSFLIEIQPDELDIGLTICIDTTSVPLVSTWKWSGLAGVVVLPDWDGPHCFTITSIPIAPVIIDTADVYFMETADLDRDNYFDLIYTGNTAPGLFVAYGTPFDTLEDPVNLLPGITQAAIAVDFVDTNRALLITQINTTCVPFDTVTKAVGLLDIIVTTPTEVIVLRNQNDTSRFPNPRFRSYFAPETFSISGRRIATVPSVSVADFDGDQLLDIFAGPDALFAGDGSGGFVLQSNLASNANAVSKSDFDNDGSEDLLIVSNELVTIFLNDGIGNFTPSGQLFIDTANFEVAGVNAVADLDRDGFVDFAVATPNVDMSGQSLVTVGFGDGLGNISLGDVITLNISGVVYNLDFVDVDRDQILDLVVSNGTEQQVEIFRGKGDRTFHNREVVNLQSGDGFTFALTTADLNRDGHPDFLSGTSGGGGLVLGLNQLTNVGVLQDEMVVSGLDNVSLTIINPLGFEISSLSKTVAGSEFYKLPIGGDPTVLDEETFDYNLIQGEYTLIMRPSSALPGGGATFSVSIGINGSQQIRVADDYDGSTFLNRAAAGGGGDSILFYYTVGDAQSVILPVNGIETTSDRPVFMWDDHPLGIASQFQFQLDRFIDFRLPIYDTVIDNNAFFVPAVPLSVDSIFYWRFRNNDGGPWSEYSRTFAAVIGEGCCQGFTGNVDCDPSGASDISDLTVLIDHLFINFPPLCCKQAANIDGDECTIVDISDLTALIDNLFINFTPTAPCR